tara:strand:+ start:158 stop:592 length:435 start_codon:yes stop_codon:yes gene_type:complete
MKNIKKIIDAHMPSNAELLSFKYNPSSDFIKVVIDSREELSIHDTARLARNIKNDDYILSNFPNGVRLEVGSPGVGSKLERVFQYKKNIGRNIELVYDDGSGIIKKTYSLIDVKKDGIVIEENKKNNDILFKDIKSAKVKVSFD